MTRVEVKIGRIDKLEGNEMKRNENHMLGSAKELSH